MNEQKLREMMKIYNVSKQVNKKAEKNFIKFSSQYYKTHKSEITPEFLNEINSLRTKIKVEKETYSKQTSPIYSPRMTDNPLLYNPCKFQILVEASENKVRFDSAHSNGADRMEIFKVYNEEINDLKQQLNKVNQIVEVNKKLYDHNMKELNEKLIEQQKINALLYKKIQDMKANYEEKGKNRQLTEISNFSIQNQDELSLSLTKEQSRELFQSEIQRALEKYSNKNNQSRTQNELKLK